MVEIKCKIGAMHFGPDFMGIKAIGSSAFIARYHER